MGWSKRCFEGKIISISTALKRQRLQLQLDLEKNIKILEKKHQQTGSSDDLKALDKSKQELDSLLTYQAEGALRFIGRTYYEMGNRAGKLFAFQLRKIPSSRVVSKIKHPHSYYMDLYRPQELEHKKEKITAFLAGLQLPKILSEEADDLTSPITERERFLKP